MIFDNADSSPFKTATADHEAITFVFSPYGYELYVLDGTEAMELLMKSHLESS